MRKPIIVGNWKMNKTMKETKEFMEAVDAAAASENAVFGIGAPYTALSAAVAGAKNLVIAAENCHWEDSGAFTGEISVPMLQEVGVTHCIIGHSERREMFNDTDETVNKKAKRLIDQRRQLKGQISIKQHTIAGKEEEASGCPYANSIHNFSMGVYDPAIPAASNTNNPALLHPYDAYASAA